MIHYKLVTIEHFKAQASPPLSPVFRLFKAVGYTEQQPGGMKGQSLGNDFAAGGGGNLVGLNGNAELNPVGIIVFSLFRGSRYYDNLKDICMHHIVYLRPVCSHCNPSLGVH